MCWLKEGDTCTKVFHLHANQRKRRNHIVPLLVEGVTLVSEADKADVAFENDETILGS
jgi:hypothetical protein